METPDVSRIGAYIKEQRESARVSLRRLAEDAGVSNPYLSQIERGLRKPSAEILQQLAKALRISAEQLYIQAGLLDESHEQPSVVSAVHADAVLTDRQKRVLLDIYDSYVAEHSEGAVPQPTRKPTPQPKSASKAKTPSSKTKPKSTTTKARKTAVPSTSSVR